MADVKAGSVAAFDTLYRRYRVRAQCVARAVCRDDGRAQEAVQEAFTSIWSTRTSYDVRVGSVAPWILTVVRYRAIDVARRHGRRAALRAGDDSLYAIRAPVDVAEHVAKRLQAQALRSAIARLPEPQREVLALSFYGELSHTEIAAHLDLPTGTVKGRARLGLQRLRSDIGRAAA